MVCHLTGIRETGALARKWTSFPRNVFNPRKKLASCSELFDRLCGNAQRFENGVGQVIQLSEKQESAFKALHRLRNDYAHLTPRKRSSIARFYAKLIVEEVIEVISLIAADPHPFREMGRTDKVTLNSKIAEIRSLVNERGADDVD